MNPNLEIVKIESDPVIEPDQVISPQKERKPMTDQEWSLLLTAGIACFSVFFFDRIQRALDQSRKAEEARKKRNFDRPTSEYTPEEEAERKVL